MKEDEGFRSKACLYRLNHGEKSHLLFAPNTRRTAVEICVGLKGQTASIFDVAPIVRGNPAVVTAKHQNDAGIRFE